MNRNIPGQNLENLYLSNPNFPIIKNNYIIISGCSGAGKSTLLSELANRGHSVVLEPGRQIVKEQLAIEGNALPWMHLEKFLDLALSRYLFQFNSHKEQQQLIFFDRSIIDAVLLDSSQPEYFKNAAKNFKYNRLVFLVPPWEEIFSSDAERQHSFECAKKEFEALLIKYKNFGYETLLIPKISVSKRVDFILEKLKSLSDKTAENHFYISKAKRLLEWNKEKLTSRSDLKINDIAELFASTFIIIANGRMYHTNVQNYYEFLNQFRSDIETLNYEVQEYFNMNSTVIMPLKARVKRLKGYVDIFDAIMLIKFDDLGKIIHWQEVYSISELKIH